MENRLISMTDFVLEEQKHFYENRESWAIDFLPRIFRYAEFLKRPLELGMFVPCDEDGNVLQEPKAEDYFNVNIEAEKFTKEDSEGLNKHYSALMFYEKAKERVLFEGISIQNTKDWIEFYGGIRVYVKTSEPSKMFSFVFRDNEPVTKTIEDLVKYNLTLTNNALKLWE